MRTTLTIDADVEALLKQRLRDSGEPLKHAINKYLRLGMLTERQDAERKPFKVRTATFDMPEAIRQTHKVADWLQYLDGVEENGG